MGDTITVANIRTCARPDGVTSVYVGRPSSLGNPFEIGRDGDRDEVIAKYAAWLDLELDNPQSGAARKFAKLRKALARHGHITLVCWCAPEPCHADAIKARLEAAK